MPTFLVHEPIASLTKKKKKKTVYRKQKRDFCLSPATDLMISGSAFSWSSSSKDSSVKSRMQYPLQHRHINMANNKIRKNETLERKRREALEWHSNLWQFSNALHLLRVYTTLMIIDTHRMMWTRREDVRTCSEEMKRGWEQSKKSQGTRMKRRKDQCRPARMVPADKLWNGLEGGWPMQWTRTLPLVLPDLLAGEPEPWTLAKHAALPQNVMDQIFYSQAGYKGRKDNRKKKNEISQARRGKELKWAVQTWHSTLASHSVLHTSLEHYWEGNWRQHWSLLLLFWENGETNTMCSHCQGQCTRSNTARLLLTLSWPSQNQSPLECPESSMKSRQY